MERAIRLRAYPRVARRNTKIRRDICRDFFVNLPNVVHVTLYQLPCSAPRDRFNDVVLYRCCTRMIQSRDGSDRGKEAEGNNRMKQEEKKRKRKSTFYSFILEVMRKEQEYRIIRLI